MRVRKAEPSDFDGMVSLIGRFIEEGIDDFAFTFDLDSVKTSLNILIEQHIVVVAVKDDTIIGMIAATVAPANFNYNILIATEVMWYMDRAHREATAGIRLLGLFEDLAQQMGATHIAMSYLEKLNPGKLRAFYEKRGYQAMQTQYVRSIR